MAHTRWTADNMCHMSERAPGTHHRLAHARGQHWSTPEEPILTHQVSLERLRRSVVCVIRLGCFFSQDEVSQVEKNLQWLQFLCQDHLLVT
jgi:hypothetical protein